MNALQAKIETQSNTALKLTLKMIDQQIAAEELSIDVTRLEGEVVDYSNIQAMNKVRFTLLTVLEVRDPEFTNTYYARFETEEVA
jgi:hypothetical protein